MESISELYDQFQAYGNFTAEYYEKQIHKVPEAPVVRRVDSILKRCKDKAVLNCGSTSGTLHDAVKKVASKLWGMDKDGSPDFLINFDDPFAPWPAVEPDIIVVGEVLEHLSNPGLFLDGLKRYDCPIILTVPNAGATSGFRRGIENVNRDHVAWYSYRTLRTLVERHGYEVDEWAWYNGKPLTAEGLIFVVK